MEKCSSTAILTPCGIVSQPIISVNSLLPSFLRNSFHLELYKSADVDNRKSEIAAFNKVSRL